MVIRTLTERDRTLPTLRHLFLNLRAEAVPPFGSSSLDSVVYQHHLLDAISAKRPHLCLARIGPCLWRYSVTGTGWTPMPTQQTIAWWIHTFTSMTVVQGVHSISKMMMLNWST
jgi:thiaminase